MSKLCPSRLLLDAATRAGKAIAGLNFYNAETLIAHVRAAQATSESIILQTTEATIDYIGLEMIVGMATAAADQLEQPIALQILKALARFLASGAGNVRRLPLR